MTAEESLRGWMKENGDTRRVYQAPRIETKKFRLETQTVKVPVPEEDTDAS